MVAVAAQAMRFFAHESCGKCFPCRIGTQRLMERLEGGGPTAPDLWISEVQDVSHVMQGLSACGLGTAAPNIVTSLLRYFPDQLAAALAARPQGEAAWTT
jgi:NADH:ubiquinone oxidoreductase subunit F (NADH-binding)